MRKLELLQAITSARVIAILRGMPVDAVVSVAQALHAGGVRVLEITADSPGVMRMIEAVREELGDHATIGAGTILDAETARAAILAGAEFIFAPNVNPAVIEIANRYGCVSVPGALTPSEIVGAYEAGASMVKLFPAATVGPAYVKMLKGPLAHIPLCAVGGVDARNAAEFVRAGVDAVGVGSALVTAQDVREASYERVEARARELVDALAEAAVGAPRY
jgi:2-dehydro-3-deoxyphosphogluconate aldolase / (4S)-4-hydroxy-2-oxoglutarate aldolase